MRTVFSTAGVHPRLRFDYWHEVACKWIVPHYSKPQCRGTFHAELQSDKIGNIDMVAFANSAMTVSSSAFISPATSKLGAPLAGPFTPRFRTRRPTWTIWLLRKRSSRRNFSPTPDSRG